MRTFKIAPLRDPVKAEITIPGSKSYTNRAILLAAMTRNKVRVLNPLFSDDTQAMVQCLRTLGIKIDEFKDATEVSGSVDQIEEGNYELDANLSGTTLRFILPMLTVVPGVKILKGKEGLNNRPINDLVDALREVGANIEYLNRQSYPPLRVNSSTIRDRTIPVNGSTSSQYLSALLMIAPLIGKVVIRVEGEQVSKPYVDMTIDTMKRFGVEAVNNGYKEYIISDRQKYNAEEYLVEGDFSSAGYFLAIAALTRSTITLRNLNPDSVQADKRILNVLEMMGSKLTYGKNTITVEGKGVKPIDVDMLDFPDQAQTLAVLAAFADGATTLSGIRSLRVKETERVIALETELKKMGIETSSTLDTLTIHGGNPKPARIDTYGDHRMAMSFAVAGTKLRGVEIVNPDVVSKTFPDFWEKLGAIGVGIDEN